MVKTNNFLAIFFNAKFLNSFLEFLSVFLNITYFSNYFCLGMQKKRFEIGFLQLIYRANCGFTLLPTACRLPTANYGQLPIADGIQKTRQNGMYTCNHTCLSARIIRTKKLRQSGTLINFLPNPSYFYGFRI